MRAIQIYQRALPLSEKVCPGKTAVYSTGGTSFGFGHPLAVLEHIPCR